MFRSPRGSLSRYGMNGVDGRRVAAGVHETCTSRVILSQATGSHQVPSMKLGKAAIAFAFFGYARAGV